MNDKTEFVADLYKMMSEEKIFMTYLGDITPEITNALLKAIKYDNSNFSKEVAIKKKIYKIIVECLENICKHSEQLEKELRPAIFLLGRQEDYYYIITGNYLYNNEIDPLRTRIDDINNLDREEIRTKYIGVLSHGDISIKQGAGLGMIDVALKSGNKLEYEFIPLKDAISFYVLKVKIKV